MYEYRCKHCGTVTHSDLRDDWIICTKCARMAYRVWGFHVLPSMQPAFNPATGTYISNQSQLKSQLDAASEKASTPRTIWDAHGEPHEVTPPPAQYVPVDLRDREALGVTSEGLDATYDALRRSGNDPAADRLRRVIE